MNQTCSSSRSSSSSSNGSSRSHGGNSNQNFVNASTDNSLSNLSASGDEEPKFDENVNVLTTSGDDHRTIEEFSNESQPYNCNIATSRQQDDRRQETINVIATSEANRNATENNSGSSLNISEQTDVANLTGSLSQSQTLQRSVQQQQHHQNDQRNQSDFHEVKHVELFGVRIVALTMGGKERLCLAQISNTLLKEFSYNEIHNRRVALGITCEQCTPTQLEMLRRAGAMPSSSRRCGMITMREAERLCRSFLLEEQPPELPENFYFTVAHRVNYGCKGRFIPARYISSRAKCIECMFCNEFYSPNKFIFHSHKQPHVTDCNPPDSPNINSWRKHIDLDAVHDNNQEIKYIWEDVKSLFNGGTRRRAPATSSAGPHALTAASQMANQNMAQKTTLQQRCKEAQRLVPDDEQLIDVECEEPTPVKSETGEIVQGDRRKLNVTNWSQIGRQYCGSTNVQKQASLLKLNNADHPPATGASQIQKSKEQQSGSSMAIKRLAHGSHQQLSSKRFAANYQRTYAFGNSGTSTDTERLPATPYQACSPPGTGGHEAVALGSPLIAAQSLLAGGNLLTGTPRRQEEQQQLDKSLINYPPANANSTNFIYSQLYSQLMQSRNQQVDQQQQQLRAQFSAIDTQLALRHHLWSNLLANLQCNAAASIAGSSSQAPQSVQQAYNAAPGARTPTLMAPHQHCSPPMSSNGGGADISSLSNFSLGLIPTQLYPTQTTLTSFSNENGCK